LINVLTIFGTRPEAIKLAPVIRELEARGESVRSTVCVSAQHRGMLDQVLQAFGIVPDFDLDLMRSSQSPAEVVGNVMNALTAVLDCAAPDLVLVQGDTSTTFASAFAAYLRRIPVGHVEAGLRTGNPDHPFPEEMNRILTTRVAALHFAPTESARAALLAENVDDASVIVTGNTVIDALLATVDSGHRFGSDAIAALDFARPVVLVTTHRRESFGEPLAAICSAIRTIAGRNSDHQFVLPVHPNPHVHQAVHGALCDVPNVLLCKPLNYVDFVNLMARCRLILTDSGGIQEEAPSLDVPVLVLRRTTERPEGIEAGCSKLVGTDGADIVDAAEAILHDMSLHARMAAAPNPFGDGLASKRIVDIVIDRFGSDPGLDR